MIDADEPRSEPGRGFWVGFVLGAPIVGYGIIELVDRTGWSRSVAVARWLFGGLVLHDFVLVPAVVLVVWAVGRWSPRAWRDPLRAGVLASVLAAALAWPGLSGAGNRVDNPTIHPLDYGTALLTVLAMVWASVLAWAILPRASRALRSRARARDASDPGSPRTSRTRAPD